MKLLFLSLSVFIFLACSATKPSVTEYRIIGNNEVKKSKLSICNKKSLKIAQAFSSTSLMTTNMDYVLGNNKIYSYTQAQWSNTPNRSISLELLKNIRKTNLFKYTQNAKTRSKSDLLLETNIEDFLQYYNADLSVSYSNVIMNFTLIDLRTNNVIASKTLKSKVQTKSIDAEGGSEALNKALSNILNEINIWLEDTCK